MPVMATLLSIAVLLWVGSHLAQLLFHAARERMTAQNPPATMTVILASLGWFAAFTHSITSSYNPLFPRATLTNRVYAC